MTIVIPDKRLRGQKREDALKEFASGLEEISDTIGFRVSARGWCYELEEHGLTKADFDFVEKLINDCRKWGILPVDFVAEEEGRKFSGIEVPNTQSIDEYIKEYLEAVLECEQWYTPEWWDGEEYYIQMIVEKIDLKTLFEPVCKKYHIPIATSKGWSSILMRAEYSKRFSEAENDGLKCVLLYYGDHDPDGIRISEFLRKNLEEIENIYWEDGTDGYDPGDLIIDRFGLDYDFIEENGLTWLNDLITGSKRDLASPSHKNHYMQYVQDYLKRYGARKCEANAVLKRKKEARKLCEDTIKKYLGDDAMDRFHDKRQVILDRAESFRESTGIDDVINEAITDLEDTEDEE